MDGDGGDSGQGGEGNDENEATALDHTPSRKDVKRLKEELLRWTRFHQVPHNILLFGTGGAGKSSFVNTIFAVLSGQKDLLVASAGEGDTQSNTLRMNRHERCGLKEKFIADNTEDAETVRQLLEFLPTIIDMSALVDPLPKSMMELIDLIIGGFIPPGLSLPALEDIEETYGPGSLRIRFDECNPKWKVSKIVYVHSCSNQVPKGLIKELHKLVSKPKKIEADAIGTYCLLSKRDLVNENDEHYQKVKKDLQEAWNIKGTTRHFLREWRNYCDDVGYDDPQIETNALGFLKLLMTPTPDASSQHVSHLQNRNGFCKTIWKTIELNWHWLRITGHQMHISLWWFFAAVAFTIFCILLLKGMSVETPSTFTGKQ